MSDNSAETKKEAFPVAKFLGLCGALIGASVFLGALVKGPKEAPAQVAAAESSNGAVPGWQAYAVLPDKPCVATYERFNKIKVGSPLVTAERILECKGELVSETKISGTTYRTLYWKGENLGSGITLSTEGNRITNKIQLGLQ